MGKRLLGLLPVALLLVGCGPKDAAPLMSLPQGAQTLVDDDVISRAGSNFVNAAEEMVGNSFEIDGTFGTDVNMSMNAGGFMMNIAAKINLDFSILVLDDKKGMIGDYQLPSLILKVNDLDISGSLSASGLNMSFGFQNVSLEVDFDAVNRMVYLDLTNENIKPAVKYVFDLVFNPLDQSGNPLIGEEEFNEMYDYVFGNGLAFVSIDQVMELINGDTTEKEFAIKETETQLPEISIEEVFGFLFTAIGGTFYTYEGDEGIFGFVANINETKITEKLEMNIPENIKFGVGLLLEGQGNDVEFAITMIRVNAYVNVVPQSENEPKVNVSCNLSLNAKYSDFQLSWKNNETLATYNVDIVSNALAVIA